MQKDEGGEEKWHSHIDRHLGPDLPQLPSALTQQFGLTLPLAGLTACDCADMARDIAGIDMAKGVARVRRGVRLGARPTRVARSEARVRGARANMMLYLLLCLVYEGMSS